MIITLSGSNSYMLNKELADMVRSFVDEHTDMALERLDGEESEYNQIRGSVESMPFLASKKMVVLRKPGSNKKFAENIAELLEAVSEATDLIIVEPKLDKRSSYYKTLKKRTDYREYTDMDDAQLSNWLVNAAKEQGGTLSRPNAALLIRRIGTDQQTLHSELMKLLSYDKNITKDNIELLTEPTPQSSTFDLIDAAISGKTQRALAIYEDQRKQRIEPLAIIGLLAWQLHILAVIKTAGDKDAAEIARDAKLNPYVVRKSSGLARSFPFGLLKDLIAETHQLDVRMKSESIDADEAMKQLIIRLGAR